jgi:hypothetical protein
VAAADVGALLVTRRGGWLWSLDAAVALASIFHPLAVERLCGCRSPASVDSVIGV